MLPCILNCRAFCHKKSNIIHGRSYDTSISHLFLNCRTNTELVASTMGMKPIFYQLSKVYELIFIFYYGMIERTDGSAIGVKPIFIAFPWYLN
jgi:hypothetical protein